MAELTYRDAVAAGIAQEMERDPNVVFLGEDVAHAGGVFKATVGLLEKFGPKRVRDCPISEQAILGAAMGAATRELHDSVDANAPYLHPERRTIQRDLGDSRNVVAWQEAKAAFIVTGRGACRLAGRLTTPFSL